MQVEMLRYPSRDDIIMTAAIAKTSYHATPCVDMMKRIKYPDAVDFIRKLIDMGHESAIEPLVFTFNISGVSRIFSHQAVRHRIASYLQRSARLRRRYTENDFIIPSGTEFIDIYVETWKYIRSQYERLLSLGEDPDRARRVLPQGLATELTITINARSLRNFLNLRLSPKADFEIREVAMAMARHLVMNGLSFLISDILDKYSEVDEDGS